MATERQLLFVFKSPARARIFVERVVRALKRNVALYIDGEAVIVIDGAEKFRRKQILDISRVSGADLPRAR